MNTDGNIVIGTSVDMYGMNTGLKKIQNSIRKIQYLTGGILSITGFVKFGKAALEAASDLQEVQNIVDVSFGEMSYVVDNFAKNAVEKFGMSEVAAKETAGSFMAMGKALGLSADEAGLMSLKLTELTGDFSSFYNISQEYARVAMAAVYTGETETLKRYGIVLTEANLQQYALSQGIDKSVKKMDAREKAILRYNYIMQATADIEGDFIRTQNSWANQVRVLEQRWTQFLNVLGNGLIQVFTPAVQYLNKFLSNLIQFSNAAGQVLSKLFGIKWNDIANSAGTLADNTGALSVNADDAADAEEELGDAVSKAGKKAKNQLAPWDELTNLTSDLADSSDDIADSGLGIGSIDWGDFNSAISGGWGDIGDNFFDKIFDAFDLGRALNLDLKGMLQNIDWDTIFDGAKDFGNNLARFLNGLISPSLFSEVGKTIANALNTAIYFALEFGETFNWKNLGNSIAAGINSFFETFDFAALAKTINTWAKGILSTIIRVLEKVEWKQIGIKIGEFLRDIDWIEIMKMVVEAIYKALNAAFEVWRGAFEIAPLETLVASLMLLPKLMDIPLVQKFSNAFKEGFEYIYTYGRALLDAGEDNAVLMTKLRSSHPTLTAFTDLFVALGVNIGNLFADLTSGTVGVIGSFARFREAVGSAVENFRASIPPIVKGVGSILAVLGEFFATKGLVIDLFDAWRAGEESIGFYVGKFALLAGEIGLFTGALTLLLGPVGLVIGALTALAGAVVAVWEEAGKISTETFDAAFANMIASTEGGTHSLQDFKQAMVDVQESVTVGSSILDEKFQVFENAGSHIDTLVTTIDGIGIAMKASREVTESEIEQLATSFSQLADQMIEQTSAAYDYVIAQETFDLQYLESIGEINEEEKRIRADHIATLQRQKQETVNNYKKISAAVDGEVKALAEYQRQLDDGEISQEKYNELIEKSADVLIGYSKELGATSKVHEEYERELESNKKKIENFAGSLDLVATSVENYDDLKSQVRSTLNFIGDSYKETTDIVERESERYAQTLDNLKYTEEEREAAIGQHNIAVQAKLSEVHDTYITVLDGIEKDVVAFVPQVLQNLYDEWDNKTEVEKGFLGFRYGGRDQWLYSELKNWINDFYDDQMTDDIQEALGAAGIEGSEYAAQTSRDIMESFFEEGSVTANYDFEHVLKPDIKDGLEGTLEYAEGVMDNYDISGSAERYGAETVDGYNRGIDNNQGSSQWSIWGWMNNVWNWIHDSVLNFGSPSKALEDFGLDTVMGYNEGIEQNQGDTQNSINEWMASILAGIQDPRGWGSIGNFFNEQVSSISSMFDRLGVSINNTMMTMVTSLRNEWAPVASWISTSVISPIQQMFTNFLSFIQSNAATGFVGAWRQAVQSVSEVFNGLGNSISSSMRSAINGILNLIESGINSMVGMVNNILNSVNDGLGMFGFGGIGTLPYVNLPRLASGAVLPPNKPFAAIVGDQKNGTNIETPLSTMIEAFNAARGDEENLLRQQNELLRQILQKEFSISSKSVFDSVRTENNSFINRTGRSAFVY